MNEIAKTAPTMTELIALSTDDAPLAIFRPGAERMIEAMTENLQGDVLELHQLPQAKVPGGGGDRFKIDTGGGATESDEEIIGVPLGFLNCGYLWGAEEMGDSEKPVLITHDFRYAYMENDDIGTLDADILEAARVETDDDKAWFDWNKLPYTEFGSGKNGKGKRAKEFRLIPILRPNKTLPIVVRVPPASVQGCDNFRRGAFDMAYYYHTIRLTLQTVPASAGTPEYSKIVFECLPDTLTYDQGQMLKGLYVTTLRERHDASTLDV